MVVVMIKVMVITVVIITMVITTEVTGSSITITCKNIYDNHDNDINNENSKMNWSENYYHKLLLLVPLEQEMLLLFLLLLHILLLLMVIRESMIMNCQKYRTTGMDKIPVLCFFFLYLQGLKGDNVKEIVANSPLPPFSLSY